MRRLAFALTALAGIAAAAPAVEAQSRRQSGDPLVLNVRPRSFLDPGNVVPQGSENRYAAAAATNYLLGPPWRHRRDQFGEGTLPDPLTGPFIGAQNPFGPIDYPAPAGLVR